MQAIGMLLLKTGSIDKDKLGLRVGENAIDAMAGGLRFS
jgi:hypothetical protein